MEYLNRLFRAPVRWLLAGRDRDEHGQGLAEYSMILALIVIVAVTALTGFGTKVASLISEMTAAF